jgi:hypothetical protein
MDVHLFFTLTVPIRWRLLFPTLCWSINCKSMVTPYLTIIQGLRLIISYCTANEVRKLMHAPGCRLLFKKTRTSKVAPFRNLDVVTTKARESNNTADKSISLKATRKNHSFKVSIPLNCSKFSLELTFSDMRNVAVY